MRQALELKTGQQLVMTPQLQQSLRLLQFSGLDFQVELMRAIQDNPMLELVDDNQILSETPNSEPSYAEVLQQDWDQGKSATANPDDDDFYPETATSISLEAYLRSQLGTTRALERDMLLVDVLIDELDENGYLHTPLEEVAGFFEAEHEVTEEELTVALRLLQSFDPPGIAARSLSECLLLQLSREMSPGAQSEVVACAKKICANALDALAAADMGTLQAVTGADISLIRQAHTLIKGLDPRPGKAWSTPAADYAVPDVLVRKINHEWVLSLNHGILPKVRINAEYESMIRTLGKKEDTSLSEQLNHAKGFLKQVNHRFSTILDVSRVIMKYQTAFLEEGMSAMQPLTLKEVAQELDIHESTVSRATTQKFIATPHGVFELKHFFGSGLATESGEQTSAKSIQLKIKALVDAEDSKKPFSDSKLCNLLMADGLLIARRTVAKYREAIGIPPASRRKAQAFLKG
ncbi:RNA polymerase sigma-54 factor [Advenella faeciporci]|uniref:RNA polymerase sigma-54 factor n=1 Tax=Advenella faeciporci TaxID=797535 RepID=A0A918JM55_9BURK|nr:RNA polymerase factor sigma-54 [Advenella faeciporci]GGW89079.1 RNA polymerase sigma-54 factor [Advenella faeciporci]